VEKISFKPRVKEWELWMKLLVCLCMYANSIPIANKPTSSQLLLTLLTGKVKQLVSSVPLSVRFALF